MALTILIVDDSRTMRNVHCQSIAEFDKSINTIQAENGIQALEAVNNPDNSISMILLDWNMPEMDGLTFLQKFRTINKKTPVVMVTTEAEKPRIITAIKSGANGYLIKPFTKEKLIAKIEEVINTIPVQKECKFQSKCPYFQGDTMPSKLNEAEEMKQKFCHSKNEACALYKVIDGIGVASLSPSKTPLDLDWAEGVLVCMGNWTK